MTSATTGAALLSGYVLGRTKKGKAAVALATWMFMRKIDPAKVTSLVTGSPAVEELTGRMRKELATAGKEAASAAVAARADRLADTLHRRTLKLREELPGEEGDESGAPERRRKAQEETRERGGSEVEAEPEEQAEAEPEDRPTRRTARHPLRAAGPRRAKAGETDGDTRGATDRSSRSSSSRTAQDRTQAREKRRRET